MSTDGESSEEPGWKAVASPKASAMPEKRGSSQAGSGSWLTYCLTRTLSTILNRNGESGQPCLMCDFSGIALSSSPFSLMLAVSLLYIAFIVFRFSIFVEYMFLNSFG
ncbi:hypothetical protein STEG23_009502 [Scotinomys teguina]